MNLSIPYISSTDTTEEQPRGYLELTRQEWLWPLGALLCMSMVGLGFPLGYLGLLVVLVNRFKHDRYDFLIICTLWFGGYGFTNNLSYPFVKSYDVGLVFCLIALMVLRKPSIVKKTLIAYGLYVIALLALAKMSDERMTVQLRMMKSYLYFIYFLFPLLVFANHDFDIRVFFKRVMPYALIICIFYAIDGLIFSGNVLVPGTYIWNDIQSRFYELYWAPFSFGMHRKYPPGLFWLALCIIPIIKYYKLRPWQWIVIALAMLSSRTFTVISGLVFVYVVFQGRFKKTAIYMVLALLMGIVLYVADTAISGPLAEQSAMRISSSVNQLIGMNAIQDDEDLAEVGSGRMAQALPKIDLVFELKKEMTGLGFLHPEYTTNPKYIIFNDYYTDVSNAEEISTGIEVEILQIFVNIGFIGIVVYVLFYGYVCYLVRRYKYARYFYSVVACMLWFGIGGFASLSQPMGLILASLAYGVVLLSQKQQLTLNENLI